MAVTNLLAFTAYLPDTSLANLVLEAKGIDPALSDENEISSAWGMLEKAKSSAYAQGRTSESLSFSARKRLVYDAKAIFKKHGIVYVDDFKLNVTGYKW